MPFWISQAQFSFSPTAIGSKHHRPDLNHRNRPENWIRSDFSAIFILIPIFGSVLLVTKVALLFWFNIFNLLSFLSHSRLYSLSFLGASNAYSTFLKISKKLKKNHKFDFLIFSKFFLHNHYLKLFLDWFTRNCDFNCGGWTCWMKSVATKTSG